MSQCHEKFCEFCSYFTKIRKGELGSSYVDGLSLSLSLDKNLREKGGGKEKTGETRFASLLSPSHGSLRFVTSLALALCATCTSPMHLICPRKFCISIVFSFSWYGCNTQEKWKKKGYAKFWGANKVNKWQMCKWRRRNTKRLRREKEHSDVRYPPWTKGKKVINRKVLIRFGLKSDLKFSIDQLLRFAVILITFFVSIYFAALIIRLC